MSTFAITGSASGMGRATAELLRSEGHTVIGIDLHDAEIVADLSTAEGRRAAASKIAVTRWMRRTAVTAEWAGQGIRMSAIAPGRS